MVGCSALLTLAVLLTLSRGAALAVLVMAVVFLLRFGVNRRILAGGSLIAGITLALPSEFFNASVKPPRPAERGGSTYGTSPWKR